MKMEGTYHLREGGAGGKTALVTERTRVIRRVLLPSIPFLAIFHSLYTFMPLQRNEYTHLRILAAYQGPNEDTHLEFAALRRVSVVLCSVLLPDWACHRPNVANQIHVARVVGRLLRAPPRKFGPQLVRNSRRLVAFVSTIRCHSVPFALSQPVLSPT